MAVLDSSAIIHILHETEIGRKIQDQYAIDSITTSVSMHEVCIGSKLSDRSTVLQFFGDIEILPFDKQASEQSIVIEQKLKLKGRMIQKLDIFIAAICIVNKLPLLTCDKGFLAVDGLDVIFLE